MNKLEVQSGGTSMVREYERNEMRRRNKEGTKEEKGNGIIAWSNCSKLPMFQFKFVFLILVTLDRLFL